MHITYQFLCSRVTKLTNISNRASITLEKSLPIRNIIFTYRCIRILFTVCFLAWLIRLLLLSGDLQPNLGPTSTSSANDTSFSSSDSQEILANDLSILHLNVQSLLPKIDVIRVESVTYDIAVFTESWLKPNVTDDLISLQNFLPPFRTDRNDRPGGGVVIYARDTLSCKRRKDIEINGLEAVWLEIAIKSKKVLIGGARLGKGSKINC